MSTQPALMDDPHSIESKVKVYSGKVPSLLGKKVFRLLDELYYGIYHVAYHSNLGKVAWDDQDYIFISVLDSQYATYDSDYLTRLVFMAHAMGLRVAIGQSGPCRIKLEFWQRKSGMDGRIDERHPTLDQAVDMFKRSHPKVFESVEAQ